MGIPVLALRHISGLNPAIELYSPPSESPATKVKEPTETHLSTPKIDAPFKGWQIFKNPIFENGAYLVKFNPEYKDLSVFNDNEKLARLKYELNWIASFSKVKHLIISFYDCHNANRTDDIAYFLEEQRASFIKSGRKLSLVHLEGNLYNNTHLKSLDAFVHNNVSDAIGSSGDQLSNHEHEEELPLPSSPAPQHFPKLLRYNGQFTYGISKDSPTDLPEAFLG